MNSLEHAEIMTGSGEMEDRKYKGNEAMAKAGVVQYGHFMEEEIWHKLLKEGVITASQCDLSPEEATNIMNDMRNPNSAGPSDPSAAAAAGTGRGGKKRGRTPPPLAQRVPPLPDDPAKVLHEETKAKFNKQKTQALAYHNTMRTLMPSSI